MLSLNKAGDVEINIDAYKSLKLRTKFAMTAATVSGIKGTYSGKGIMELCLPPYLMTSLDNIQIIVKTINGDWGTARVTASIGGSIKVNDALLANSLLIWTRMPTIYFNHFSLDDTNVQTTVTSTLTGLSNYISYTSSKKFQITNLKNLFKQALG